jgi:hypothetical protein
MVLDTLHVLNSPSTVNMLSDDTDWRQARAATTTKKARKGASGNAALKQASDDNRRHRELDEQRQLQNWN